MNIIGQKNNLELLGTIPKFMIIRGEGGSGKKTFAEYIAREMLKSDVIFAGNSISDVRLVLEVARKVANPVTFIFEDAHKMSIGAKNALLKLTEEPPKNVYITMTVDDSYTMINTLESRAMLITMETYTKNELAQLVDPEIDADTVECILSVATQPGHVAALGTLDIKKFIAFCDKVLDNIGSVSGVNAFKIANSIDFKGTGKGYDPTLFFLVMLQRMQNKFYTGYIKANASKKSGYEAGKLFDMMCVTNKYYHELEKKSIKKESTLDMWILEMRSICSL